MTKVLLVGNSENVLHYDIGPLIDSGQYIVGRFNNYILKGYEKSTGTRTDLIFRRCCDDVKVHSISSGQSVVGFVTYCELSDGMARVARQLMSVYGKGCCIVDQHVCKGFHDHAGLDNSKRLSVGCLAAAWLLTGWAGQWRKDLENPDVYLFGFGGSGHYFPKRPLDEHYHDFVKEVNYMKALGAKNLLEHI